METLQEELRISENNSSIKFTTVNPIMVDTGLAKKPRNRYWYRIIIIYTQQHTHIELSLYQFILFGT